MKTLKIIFLLSIVLNFISCIDEPAPPATDIRDEITREWNAEESDGEFPLNFTVKITKDTNDDSKILISNFHNLGTSITAYAIVFENNTIELPSQTLRNTIVRGTATIASGYERIDWTYTAEEQNIVTVTGTYTIADISKKLQ